MSQIVERCTATRLLRKTHRENPGLDNLIKYARALYKLEAPNEGNWKAAPAIKRVHSTGDEYECDVYII